MVLYWCCYNIFTMGQQFYLLRRYHQPLALIDSEHVITEGASGGNASCQGSLRQGFAEQQRRRSVESAPRPALVAVKTKK